LDLRPDGPQSRSGRGAEKKNSQMKLVKLIKMCLNETCSIVLIGENLSHAFPLQNGLKQENALSPLLFNFALEYTIRNFQ
jgi:hypothetical protein